jgi:hypothetical protein
MAVIMMTEGRGFSNAKAKRELAFDAQGQQLKRAQKFTRRGLPAVQAPNGN